LRKKKKKKNSIIIVDKEYFPKREFSFTIKKDGEETYLRYKSFSDEKELKDSIIKLNPHKIDIGAVYTVKVKFNSIIYFFIMDFGI